MDASSGHDAFGKGQDAVVLLLLTRREGGRFALEVLGVGAENSVWGSHSEADAIPAYGSLSRKKILVMVAPRGTVWASRAGCGGACGRGSPGHGSLRGLR